MSPYRFGSTSVVFLGPLHEAHADGVDEVLLRLDVGVLGGHVPEDLEEEPSVCFMMFAFVTQWTALRPCARA